jgi:hypothetical protein
MEDREREEEENRERKEENKGERKTLFFSFFRLKIETHNTVSQHRTT